jgi:hypothetical protein
VFEDSPITDQCPLQLLGTRNPATVALQLLVYPVPQCPRHPCRIAFESLYPLLWHRSFTFLPGGMTK